jgi:hypothetical protein
MRLCFHSCSNNAEKIIRLYFIIPSSVQNSQKITQILRNNRETN